MSDSNATVWKSSFWVLLLALIFVYALYNHYAGVLKGELRQVKAELQTTSLKLSNVDTALGETKQEAQTAEQKIQELMAKHDAGIQSMTSDHEQAVAELKREHERAVAALKQEHGQAVAALKQEHGQAVAALKQEHGTTAARVTAEHEEAISAVKADLEATSQTRDELQQEFDRLTAAKAELEDELAKVKKSESSLNERLVAVTETQHELEAKLAADNETIAGLNFQLNSANQLEAALRDKLSRGSARQERLQALVEKEEAAIEELKSKLVLTARQREAMHQADGAGDQAGADGQATTQSSDDLQAQLAASSSVIDELRAELAATRSELEAIQADAAKALQESRAALKEELAQAKSDHAAALKSAEERIAAAESALEQERTALEDRLKQARTGGERAGAEASAEVERLREQLEAQRNAMESLKTAHAAELKELNDRLAQADATLGDLRSEMQRQRADYDKALADAEASGKASLDQVRSLYDSAAALGGKLTEQGILLSLAGDELQFPSGSATLPEGELPTLDRVAALLEQRAGLIARVEGHTDSSGSAAINQGISQQRAEAVMAALVARGVDAGRLSAKGYGAERPVASNATETGRRANRRVEVYVVE